MQLFGWATHQKAGLKGTAQETVNIVTGEVQQIPGITAAQLNNHRPCISQLQLQPLDQLHCHLFIHANAEPLPQPAVLPEGNQLLCALPTQMVVGLAEEVAPQRSVALRGADGRVHVQNALGHVRHRCILPDEQLLPNPQACVPITMIKW